MDDELRKRIRENMADAADIARTLCDHLVAERFTEEQDLALTAAAMTGYFRR